MPVTKPELHAIKQELNERIDSVALPDPIGNAEKFVKVNEAGTGYELIDSPPGSGDLLSANNLSDLADPAEALVNLGAEEVGAAAQALQDANTYTDQEVSSLAAATTAALDGKSSTSHDHNGVYQPAGSYAASNHNHAGVYAPVSHTQGYTSGGGQVTQLTNKATGVTLNALCGRITMNGAALAAAAEVSFVVTNSLVSATDVVIVNIQSVGTVGAYFVTVSAVANGSFTISLGNCSTGSLSQALVLNFAIIKSVIS